MSVEMSVEEAIRQLDKARREITLNSNTLNKELGRYSFGWWCRFSGGWGIDYYTIFVCARLPDADSHDKPNFSPDQEFVIAEQITMHELMDAIHGNRLHHLIREHLRNVWMRVAAHEFEEWLRYDGKRVFDPHPPVNNPTPNVAQSDPA